MVTDVSLCFSSLISIERSPYCSPSIDIRKRHPEFFAISCRASTTNEAANLYKVLSFSSNQAGLTEIKQAYRTMALKYHPDVCHDPSLKKQSANMFLLLQTAFKTLSDPLSRAEYDYQQLGLSSSGQTVKTCVNDSRIGRSAWERQIAELRNWSNCRAAAKEPRSWGSRLRYQNNQDGGM